MRYDIKTMICTRWVMKTFIGGGEATSLCYGPGSDYHVMTAILKALASPCFARQRTVGAKVMAMENVPGSWPSQNCLGCAFLPAVLIAMVTTCLALHLFAFCFVGLSILAKSPVAASPKCFPIFSKSCRVALGYRWTDKTALNDMASKRAVRFFRDTFGVAKRTSC